MLRKLSVAAAIVFTIGLGCSRKEPAAAPSNEPVSAAPPATTVAPSPAPLATGNPAPAAPAVSSRLRDLVSAYLEADGQGGWRKDEKAATELEKLTAEETAQLWPLLKDQDVNIRRGAAVFLLADFDPAISDQVAAFTALLSDSDSMVRARGLDAVRQFATADKITALERLTTLLDPKREDRPENRAAVARLCGGLKHAAATAAPALAYAAANDDDSKVRAAALVAVASVLGPSFAVNTLKSSLADKDSSVRLAAAARLRQLGPAASPAATQLAAALSDESKDVSEAAAEALIRIGSPAVEPLADQLASTNASARKLAIACLIKIGPAAKPVASRIEKCKSDSDPEVRKLAEAALKRILTK